MKSPALLAAVFGALALASANANAGATTDSASFRVSLRIAAACDVSTADDAAGRGAVTVRCLSAATPYRLEPGVPRAAPLARDEAAEAGDGYTRATLIF